MGIRELRQQASKLSIKNYSKLRKDALQAAITTAETAQAPKPHAVSEADNLNTGIDAIVGRLGAGSVEEAGFHLGFLTKSEARIVRKALRVGGFSAHAAATRIARRAVA